MKSFTPYILIAALFVAAQLLSCSGGDQPAATVPSAGIPVTMGSVRPSTSSVIHVSGTIGAGSTALISTRLMGQVDKVLVKPGDVVKKGQLLVKISSADIEARKAQAEAMIRSTETALTLAERDLNRFRSLHESKSATDKELENATLQFASAKAQSESAREAYKEVIALLGYSNLTAPFDGVITKKNIDEGSIAHPGSALLILEQQATHQVEVTVQEKDIARVTLQAAATVTVKTTGEQIPGRVVEISPSAQFSGGQYLVKIELEKGHRVYPGSYAGVAIQTTGRAKDAVPMVPVSSIIHRDQLTGIYTVSQSGNALLRWVRLGKTDGDYVEVRSGLNENEQYISSSKGRLYDGAPVVIEKNQAGLSTD